MRRKSTAAAATPQSIDPLSAAMAPADRDLLLERLAEADRQSAIAAKAWYDDQCAQRTRAPRYLLDKAGALRPMQFDGDADGFSHRLAQALGSLSTAFTRDVARTLSTAPKGTSDTEIAHRVNVGLAFIASQNPKDELEATILLQFWLTNRAMVHHVTLAESASVVDHLNCHGAMTAKLGNLGVRQLEALAKLRGGGEQKVTVIHEHRHTYVGPGGQAIIGDVHTGGGGESRIERQSHGAVASLAFAPGSPVWSEDPTRDAVPVSGDEGQGQVSRPRGQRGRAPR